MAYSGSVGFVGLCGMGAGLVKNLLASGVEARPPENANGYGRTE